MAGAKKKVMVAIDESDCSQYALDWAMEKLRDSIADSTLVIFTAQPISESHFGYVYASALSLPPPELVKSVQENQKKVASLLLEKAKDFCAKHGFDAETVTEFGDPKRAICEAVEKLNIHLLVLGSHNRGSVGRAFLGKMQSALSLLSRNEIEEFHSYHIVRRVVLSCCFASKKET